MKVNNNNIKSPKNLKPLHNSNTNKSVIPECIAKASTSQDKKKKEKSNTPSNLHNTSHSHSKKFNSFIF
jgi:hypothetical protein